MTRDQRLHGLRLVPAPSAFVAGACLVLAGACSAPSRSVPDEVRYRVAHGQYAEAVQLAADAAAKSPGDAELAAAHRGASVAFMVEQGRRLTFEDKDEDALVWFGRALEVDPQSKVAADWRDKTNRKLAVRWLDVALELHAKDEIDAALAAYETSMRYAPADTSALTGRNLALMVLSHRVSLGHTYFDDGLHALADYWLELARSRFTYAHKYQPTDERTADRKKQVETVLADQRVAIAKDRESAAEFGAARIEYRLALALDPENAEAKAGVERTKVEMEVNTLLTRASMDIARGRFDTATKFVEEAAAKTVAQKDLCQGKLDAIREARLEKEYLAAIAMERDYRYEDAARAFGEILAKTPFYKDAIARRDTAQEYVRLANDLYAKAAATEDKAARLALLQQIRVFWPAYRDTEAQIEALTKELGS